MKLSDRTIIITLAVALVTITVAVRIWWGELGDASPHLGAILFFGLSSSLITLLSVWASFGNAAWLGRLTAAILSVVVLTLVVVCLGPELHREWVFVGIWGSLYGLQLLGIAIPLILVRRFGLHVSQAPDTVPRPLQFSLRGLFLVVTFIAVLLGGAIALNRFIDASPVLSYRSIYGSVTAWSTASAATALLVLWAMLSLSHTLLRLPALVVLAPAPGLFLSWLLSNGFSGWWQDALATALHTATLAGFLWILRRSGYRLVFRQVLVFV